MAKNKKKGFADSAALSYISQSITEYNAAQDDTQDNTQNNTQDNTQDNTQNNTQDNTQDITQNNTQETAQHNTHEDTYIRTQGRKGHKKPRINLAFDSAAFLEGVRIQAEREGKSITQLVNDAVRYYLNNIR